MSMPPRPPVCRHVWHDEPHPVAEGGACPRCGRKWWISPLHKALLQAEHRKACAQRAAQQKRRKPDAA